MARALITGGAGTIGQNIAKQLLQNKNNRVIIFSRNDTNQHNLKVQLSEDEKRRCEFILGDIREIEKYISRSYNINSIFHCAAIKHVSSGEQNPAFTASVNIDGTMAVLQLAKNLSSRYKIRFVHISTDKAANPSTVMGATKYIAERIIITENNSPNLNKVIIRLGNVWKSNGSVYNTWVNALLNNMPLYVSTHDATRYIITQKEATKFILDVWDEKCFDNKTTIHIPLMKKFTLSAILKRVLSDHNKTHYNNIKTIGLLNNEKQHESLISKNEIPFVNTQTTSGIILGDTPVNQFTSTTLYQYLSSEFADEVSQIDLP